MRHLAISDHHFFHHKIIEMAERPFPYCGNNPCTANCVKEMNDFMVRKWNENVEDDDVVYYVGDFAFGTPNLWVPILRKLRGHKILIRGNHDPSVAKCLQVGWPQVHSQMSVTTASNHRVLLRHKPWSEGSIPLGVELVIHGHIHNRPSPNGFNVNVSAEVLNYTPADLNQLVDSHMSVMGWSRRLTDPA